MLAALNCRQTDCKGHHIGRAKKRGLVFFSKTGQQQSSELVGVLILDPFKVMNGDYQIRRSSENRRLKHPDGHIYLHDRPKEHDCHLYIVKEGPH